MRKAKFFKTASIFVVFVLAFLVLYKYGHKIPVLKEFPFFSTEHEHQYKPVLSEKGEIEYWTCAMHPSVKMKDPGNCPICGMNLVPVRKEKDSLKETTANKKMEGMGEMEGTQSMDGTQGMRGMSDMQDESMPEDQIQEYQSPSGFVGVEISPEKQQLIGVKTEQVTRRKMVQEIRAVGIVEADERKIAHVHVKFDGWIRDMFVYEGQHVEHGDPLFTIYSPELVSSQEEYLVALKARDALDESSFPEISSGAHSLFEATRRRFHHWDISEHELKMIEKTGRPITHMTVYSHLNGYITERKFFPGMHVAEHEDVLTITDLSSVWVLANIYEYELPLVQEGQKATLELSYYPGETFTGKVMYIYPTLDTNTRTAKVRLEFPNPDMRLKPGMYTNVVLQSNMGEKLSMAEDSIIDSGDRKIVFVALGNGYFEPREIKVGQKSEGYYEVIDGLREGERVVSDALFLIDSESRLKAAIEDFGMPGHGHGGTGPVSEVSKTSPKEVNISFRPDKGRPKAGNNTFKITLTDMNGNPVGDAKVDVLLHMPAMPSMGMPAMNITAEVEPVKNGLYTANVNIPMGGQWHVKVTVSRPGRPSVSRVFQINAG